ncbi:hypothetical protein M426DRAFT_23840 [Hypoxylon sp. CI-4A]|nr:hypothetical protein M426DRAFT_23840 [Hypoxylon sp. CI-4A]
MMYLELPNFSVWNSFGANEALAVVQKLESYVGDVKTGEVMPEDVETQIQRALYWHPTAMAQLRASKNIQKGKSEITYILNVVLETLAPLDREMSRLLRDNERLKRENESN